MAVAGNYALVANWTDGIRVFDVTDRTDPRGVAQRPSPGPVVVAVGGDYALFLEVGPSAGMLLIDISNPLDPGYAGWLPMSAYPNDVVVSGDYAFVANALDGLQVVDIADPTNATIIGDVATPDWARGVSVRGNYAYVTEWSFDSALRVVDISDPVHPSVVGGMLTPGTVQDLAVAGSGVFVADGPEDSTVEVAIRGRCEPNRHRHSFPSQRCLRARRSHASHVYCLLRGGILMQLHHFSRADGLLNSYAWRPSHCGSSRGRGRRGRHDRGSAHTKRPVSE